MSPDKPREEHGSHAADRSPILDTQQASTPQLTDAELQEQYRQEYLIQLRRLSCPGCGEGGEPF